MFLYPQKEWVNNSTIPSLPQQIGQKAILHQTGDKEVRKRGQHERRREDLVKTTRGSTHQRKIQQRIGPPQTLRMPAGEGGGGENLRDEGGEVRIGWLLGYY